MSDLHGKVALVTGAGGMRGIGRACALALAREGADIVLSDVRRERDDLPPQELRSAWRSIDSVGEEIEALGRRCLKIWCDLADGDQIRAMVNDAARHFGHVDILVNNARAIIGHDKVSVLDLEEDVWNRFLAINATAVFLCTKLVAHLMIQQGDGGRIINISSDSAKRGTRNGTAYSASKFAVLGLTQSAALDLAQYQITVNAVCPGPVNTDRMSYEERAKAEKLGVSLEEYRARVVAERGKATPLGRIAEPEDVASVVAFLASGKACFITGQAYNVNGGSLFH
jgi:meso-butanediol dehydrogenase / (S,S)-butanediol dehydrogenase / diacetyl reductase